MKGCLKNFLKFIVLFLFFSFLEACDFSTLFKPDYNEGVKGYFEEYTETAAIMVQELDGKYPSDSQGITCFPSGDSRIVKLYLRNPQNYILNVSMESDDVVNNNVTVVQDETDKSIITVTYPGSWLLEKDKDDKDISGVIKIVEPVSGREFEDWSINLHADSVPPAIKSPVFQLNSSNLSEAKYIVCFYFPNLSTIGNGVHSDVNTLLIDEKKYYISGTSIYNDSECTELNEKFVSEKPPVLTADSQNNPGYDFDPAAVPEDYIAFYYLTDISPSTDEISYSFVLQDKAGLKSSEVSISNKAKKLSSPVICRTDGSELSSGESLAADEDTFLYTLLINHDGTDEYGASCGTAVINYTITETNGALVFADGTSSVLTAVSEGSVSVKLPKGTYTVTAEASKNFYLTSDEVSVSGIKIRKPAVYYISESGVDSDSQSGSAGEPYRTVQYALNQYAAGVTSGEYELDDGCDIRVLTDLTVPADFDFSSNNNSFVNVGGTGFTATVNITGYSGVRTIDFASTGNNLKRYAINVADGSVTIDGINITKLADNGNSVRALNVSGGNVIYKNSSVYDNKGNVGASIFVSGGSLELRNVTVKDVGSASSTGGAGALNISSGASANCYDCEFTDVYGVGYGAVNNGGSLLMQDCSILRGKSSSTGGGITNTGTATLKNVSIKDCLTGSTASWAVNKGSGIYNNTTGVLVLENVTISGCTFKDEITAPLGAGIYHNGSLLTVKGKNTIYSNTLADGTTASNLYMPTGSVITVDGDISGSKIGVNVPWQPSDAGAPSIGNPAAFTSGYGTDNTVLPGEIFLTENNYSITASSSGEAAFAVSGGGMSVASLSEAPTSGTYSLSTLSELKKIRDWVSSNNTLQNVTFTLEDDIDTKDEELIIGYYKYDDSANCAFMGVFDGNNHTITNSISASSINTDAKVALFSYVKGSSTVIKNLTIKGTSTRGSIVGYLDEYATVENCISETVITTSSEEIGGIVCKLGKGYIKNCINKGAISASNIEGGILGYTNGGGGAIDRCINYGSISGKNAGGIVGYMQSKMPLTNCKNSGNIIGTGNEVGGIIGSLSTTPEMINNNCNLGEVNIGAGIIGGTNAPETIIKNNCNANTAEYGIIKYFKQYTVTLSAENNYSVKIDGKTLYPSSTGNGLFNPSTITESQIKSFELSEAGSVVESLNKWATTNSTTSLTYASWKLNTEGKPELDLGEMDNW